MLKIILYGIMTVLLCGLGNWDRFMSPCFGGGEPHQQPISSGERPLQNEPKRDQRELLQKLKEIVRIQGELLTLMDSARQAFDAGQYEKAMEYYQKSLGLADRIGNQKYKADLLQLMGKLHLIMKEYDQAVERYEELGTIAGNSTNTEHDKDLETARNALFEKLRETARSLNLEATKLKYGAKSGNDPENAAQKFEQVIRIGEKIGLQEEVGMAAIGLGTIHEGWARNEKALEYYEKALQMGLRIKSETLEVMGLNGLCLSYTRLGKYSEALERCERALEINGRTSDPARATRELVLLNNLGYAHYMQGKYHVAVDYYNRSLALCRRDSNQLGEAIALNNLGKVCESWGEYDKAIRSYRESLAILDKLQVAADRKAVTLSNIGDVYFKRGNYAKAREYYRTALDVFVELKDARSQGGIYSSLGAVCREQGQYREALKQYEKALEISEKTGEASSRIECLNSIGRVHARLGQHSKALGDFDKALRISREIGARIEEGDALMNIGGVYLQQGDREQALSKFQEGLKRYEGTGVPLEWPRTLIGNVYLELGMLDQAEPFIVDGGYQAYLGRLHLVKSDYANALVNYKDLLESAQKNRNSSDIFASLTGLGVVYESIGNLVKAEEYYRKAVDFTEKLRSRLTVEQREKFFEVKVHGFLRTAPYEGLARVLMRMGKPVEALKISEYAKARSFAEAASEKSERTAPEVPEHVSKKTAELTEQLAKLNKNLEEAYEKGNQLSIEALEPQLTSAEAEHEAHKKLLRDRYPSFAAVRYPEPMDLENAALKDNEWVLSYHVTNTGVLIYLTKGRKLITGLFQAVKRFELNAMVDKFRASFEGITPDNAEDKLRAFDFESGRMLAGLLLGPILSKLPEGAHVVVVPHDQLGLLPFEMLLLDRGGTIREDKNAIRATGAHFFGDRNSISYFQSIAALAVQRTLPKPGQMGKRLLVMCDPVFTPDDPRSKGNLGATARVRKAGSHKSVLLGTLDEITAELEPIPLTGELGRELKAKYPDLTDLYEGLAAKKSVLLHTPLTQYGQILIASHGSLGTGLPTVQEPVIFLTSVGGSDDRDGVLALSDVLGLNINADVVALTACQTGFGEVISGEGVMHMGRAFQYAGGKSVIVSLWKVDQKASVDLLRSFFTHLREGKNKVEALNLARGEVRRDGFDHPFFWAAFILVGDAD